MMSSQLYPNLFSPLEIRGMILKNRILVAPKGIPPIGTDGNRALAPRVVTIGDAAAPGNIGGAVRSAYEAIRTL